MPSTLSDVAALPLALLAVAILVPACTNLWWMLHAWRTPDVHEAINGSPAGEERHTSFSAIVPFRHEPEEVVRATVERLVGQTHQDIEVVLSVGHDDPVAIEIAERLALEWPRHVTVSIDSSPVKNKPRQLNSALRACTKEFIAIFDAESLAHPELLAHADATLATGRHDVLQAGVQLVNHRTAWFSLRNCLEYFFWFRSRLHLHAEHGFIPLGGNTVFVRRELVSRFGGWDDRCLTEDCELGVRLSAEGVRVAVSYDPKLVTREETPDSLGALVRQRSRWNQGFLQVLAKGDWRRLPGRRQRLLARYTLIQPYWQALTFVALPFALLAALTLRLPLPVTLLTFVPLATSIGTVMFESVALREFGRELGLRVSLRDQAVLVASTVPYQFVLGYASVRALVRHWRREGEWEKTPHVGNHLSEPALAEAGAA